MNKLIAKNPNARHNYTIEDTIEAGIVLTGTEIKSIRAGKVNLNDSYAGIKNGEAFIYSMHISPYEQGNIFNKDPLRDRKLLLNKLEITRLSVKIKQKGYSLIPISLYFKGDIVKESCCDTITLFILLILSTLNFSKSALFFAELKVYNNILVI